MKEFKISEQQISVIKQALSEGTYAFPIKNINAVIDMLDKLEVVVSETK